MKTDLFNLRKCCSANSSTNNVASPDRCSLSDVHTEFFWLMKRDVDRILKGIVDNREPKLLSEKKVVQLKSANIPK